MRTYTWDEYYDKYYDWSESTRVRNLANLTDLGAVDEVVEVILDFDYDNIKAANTLLQKAVEAKLQFSVQDLCEFYFDLDHELIHTALFQSLSCITEEDIEDLYAVFDEDIVLKTCKLTGLPLPKALREEDDAQEVEEEFEMEQVEPYPPKIGFFWKLAAAIGAASLLDDRPKHHCGHCDGDCAHCPPHYGYRYGRWYYGHGHQYGCEFGGNKGDGGL